MSVFCDVPTIDQYNLIPFIQSRDTEVSLKHNAGKVTTLYVVCSKYKDSFLHILQLQNENCV